MKSTCETRRERENTRPWTIRDISDETRQAVILAARRDGMTISQWVNRALEERAQRTLALQPPRQNCSTLAFQVMDELLALHRRMEKMEKHSTLPDGKIKRSAALIPPIGEEAGFRTHPKG